MSLNLQWSTFGVGSGPPPGKTPYMEATVNGRRGRVLEDKGDEIVVEFYMTGDKEIVRKSAAMISTRNAGARKT